MNTFNLNLHPNEYISDYIRKHGCWEPITTEILIELFKNRQPNTVFVDIGANIGYFMLIAAQNGVPVVAFEPVAANYNLLTKTIKQNEFSQVRSYMVPLSDKEERVVLNVSNNNMGLCSTRTLTPRDHSYSQSSTTKRLDDYFGLNTLTPLIVKIDVEEQEKKVLQGMVDTLRSGKVTHIILEIARYDNEIFDLFKEYGYIYYINIGYEGEDKHSIDPNTTYLQQPKYLGTLESLETQMIKDINTHNPQRMILLYKTPNPV